VGRQNELGISVLPKIYDKQTNKIIIGYLTDERCIAIPY
jgi:hypothetical protein